MSDVYDLEQYQKSWYEKRIGTRFGDFEVTNVYYVKAVRKQAWVLTCVHCGNRRTTFSGSDYVKGRNKGVCEVCAKNSREIKRRDRTNTIDAKKAEKETKYASSVGKSFGSWEVLEYEIGVGFKVKCTACGRESWKGFARVLNHTAEQCTCDNNKKKYYDEDWIGKKYGHLTIIGYQGKPNRGFICRCDCGNEAIRKPGVLFKTEEPVCGDDCPYKNRWDGDSKTRLYRIWHGMRERCYNPKSGAYFYYGGRGISICDEWRNDFFAFRDWALSNGYRDELSIDRIDFDGNYEPENCRWATAKEQASNMHPQYTFTKYRTEENKRLVVIDGFPMTKEEWCSYFGITLEAVNYRIRKYGLSFEEAVKLDKSQGISLKEKIDKIKSNS